MMLAQVRFTDRSAVYVGAATLSCIATAFAFFNLPGFAVLFIVLAAGACVVLARYENMFHMTWLSGHLVFCVIPTVICLITGYPITYELPALCTLSTVLALALTDRPDQPVSRAWQPKPSLFVYVVLLASAVLLMTNGASFLFSIPLLVLIFGVTTRAAPVHIAIGLYMLLIAFVAAYATVYWDGFGRLILAGTLIIPTILVAQKIRLPGGKYAILLGISALGMLGTVLRFRDATLSSLLRTSLSDSNSGPILLGRTIFEQARDGHVVRLLDWLDQIILLVLAAWPRIWWSDKPLGFGAVWVAENMGPAYRGHSIASTFMGEHIYYLGLVYGTAAALAIVALLAWTYNALGRSRYLFGLGGYLAAVYVPTFYWGGMASFATRFWIGTVPLVIAIAIFQALRLSLGSKPGVRRAPSLGPRPPYAG